MRKEKIAGLAEYLFSEKVDLLNKGIKNCEGYYGRMYDITQDSIAHQKGYLEKDISLLTYLVSELENTDNALSAVSLYERVCSHLECLDLESTFDKGTVISVTVALRDIVFSEEKNGEFRNIVDECLK